MFLQSEVPFLFLSLPFLPYYCSSLSPSLQGLWGNSVAFWFDFLLVNELKCGFIYPLLKVKTSHRKWFQRLGLRFHSLLSSRLLQQCTPKVCGNDIFQKTSVEVAGSLRVYFFCWRKYYVPLSWLYHYIRSPFEGFCFYCKEKQRSCVVLQCYLWEQWVVRGS